MDKTELTIRQLLAALPAPGYDIGVLTDARMYRVEAAPASRVLRMLPFLKHRNAHGAHIYLRPSGESCYTLLDDLTAATLSRLAVEGYASAAVIETSPGSFQAWLRHTQPFPKELGTLAAKTLGEQFGADRSAADWRRFGRAPGFTNRKPQHRNPQGFYPFAHLRSSTGTVFPEADAFRARLLTLQQKAEVERAAVRLSFAARPSSRYALPVTLSRFRSSPNYHGRPAAADMAFCIAAVAQGWTEPRHRRRTQPRIPLPQCQPHHPSRLHPPHSNQSDAMGHLKSARRTRFGFSQPLPAYFYTLQPRSAC